MDIRYIKAHGAKNDFLMTLAADLPKELTDLPALSVAICARTTGVGADGWMIVDPTPVEGSHGSIRLFNSDGSEPELSGNGTRCAAALLIELGHAKDEVSIRTGAGVKHLRLLKRDGSEFLFEMNMGVPTVLALRETIELNSGPLEATLLDVGNPQCAYVVDNFDFDWRSVGAETERHARFPKRTNVSFIKASADEPHRIEVRFFERGAGETMSSGTGSTGAAVTAVARGLALNPVTVATPAGDLVLGWQGPGTPVFLRGPAQIIASGTFRHEIISPA